MPTTNNNPTPQETSPFKAPAESEILIQGSKYGASKSLFYFVSFFKAFPTWRRVFLILLLFLLVPSFFLAKYITAKVWLKNNAGLVLKAKQLSVSPTSIEVLESQYLRTNTEYYSAIARIKNPNLNLSARRLQVVFKFTGRNGTVIREISQESYLLPNEQKYVVLPRVDISEAVNDLKVDIQDAQFQKRLHTDSTPLGIGEARGEQEFEPANYAVNGSVTNQSNFRLQNVNINIILKDDFGRIIAASRRLESNLEPAEIRTFKHLWPVIFSENIKTIEIYPETNALDRNNLLLPSDFESTLQTR